MSKKMVITIGREFGAGGKTIGLKLAERLGIQCYDKEILQKASDDSGLCQEVMEKNDEKPINSFFYSLVVDNYSGTQPYNGYNNIPLNQKVFMAQFKAIKDIAEKESCIIVGRCGDYALADNPDMTSIFISANLPDRVERIAKLYNLSHEKAMDLIPKTDRKRANYYNYYSNKKWGCAASYDLCLNSSILGIDGTVDLIMQYLEKRYQ